MTILKLPFVALVFSCFTVFSNNNVKSYEIKFPNGSSFVSEMVKKQAAKIYNQIPELQYAKITVKGESENDYSSSVVFNLARVRTKNLVAFYQAVGLEQKNVRISYGKRPQLLVFKPESELLSTAFLNEKEVAKHTEVFTVKADEPAVLESKNHSFYVFEPNCFETESGTSVSKGTLEIKVTEVKEVQEIVNTGVMGEVKEAAISPKLYFKVEAVYRGVALRLKKNAKYEVYVSTDSSTAKCDLFQGKEKEKIIAWQRIKQEGFYKKELQEEEYQSIAKRKLLDSVQSLYYLKTNYLSWTMLAVSFQPSARKTVNVKLKSSDEFAIYLYNKRLSILIPAYQNLSYINRYEFHDVPFAEDCQIVALPHQANSKQFVDQKIEVLSSQLVLETKECSLGKVSECIGFK